MQVVARGKRAHIFRCSRRWREGLEPTCLMDMGSATSMAGMGRVSGCPGVSCIVYHDEAEPEPEPEPEQSVVVMMQTPARQGNCSS